MKMLIILVPDSAGAIVSYTHWSTGDVGLAQLSSAWSKLDQKMWGPLQIQTFSNDLSKLSSEILN